MLCSKILVAYDGSDSGIQSLQKAIELAETNESIEIEVLHAVEHPIITEYAAAYSYAEELEKARQQGNLVIKKAENTLSNVTNRWRTAVVEGWPAQAILEERNNSNCDLIVLGSRGLSGLKELFLGSVSHYVSQHSPVPVLIVK
jgi:nucleotide-binding universal stress UspA family protein